MELHEFNFELMGTPLLTADLVAFESEIGGVLDAAYKRFLLATNGGVCAPALTSSLLDYEILSFFSLEDGWDGLRQVAGDVNEQLGEETTKFLPVAGDTGERWIAVTVGLEASPVLLIEGETIKQIAESFDQFVQTLSQPPEPRLPLAELAKKTWADVEAYMRVGGDIRGSKDELSLFGQSIRCDNIEIFNKLIKRGVDASDISEAITVAVLNRRQQMLEILIDAGGDPAEALHLTGGPEREQMRAFLRSRLTG